MTTLGARELAPLGDAPPLSAPLLYKAEVESRLRLGWKRLATFETAREAALAIEVTDDTRLDTSASDGRMGGCDSTCVGSR